MRESTRVISNSFFLLINEGFHAVVSMAVIAILARYLYVDGFGDYCFVLAVCRTFYVVADMGVNLIVVREIAKRKEIAGEIFSASLFLRFLFSLVTVGIIAIFINLLSSSQEIIYATYVCALGVVSSFFYDLVVGTFQGFERMGFITMAGVITRSSYLVFIVLAVLLGAGLKGIFLSALVSNLIGFAVGCLIIKKFFFVPKVTFNFALSRELFMESYVLGFGRILRKASLQLDTILLKMIRSSAEAGLFQGAYKPVLQLMFIPRKVSAALFPVFSRLFAERSPSLKNIYSDSFRVLIVLMLPMVFAMILFSEEFITVLLGKKFLGAVSAFRVLSVVWGFMFLSALLLRVLTAINQQNKVTLCIAYALITNVVLDVILIPQMGFMGAAWATFFAESVLIVSAFYLVTKYLGPLSSWKIVYGPFGGGLLMGLCCLWTMDANIWFKAAVVFPLGLTLYGLYVFFTRSLTWREIQYLKDFRRQFAAKRQQAKSVEVLVTKL
jgi:O-antigen/teichoic acid export membrane protein